MTTPYTNRLTRSDYLHPAAALRTFFFWAGGLRHCWRDQEWTKQEEYTTQKRGDANGNMVLAVGQRALLLAEETHPSYPVLLSATSLMLHVSATVPHAKCAKSS